MTKDTYGFALRHKFYSMKAKHLLAFVLGPVRKKPRKRGNDKEAEEPSIPITSHSPQCAETQSLRMAGGMGCVQSPERGASQAAGHHI